MLDIVPITLVNVPILLSFNSIEYDSPTIPVIVPVIVTSPPLY